MKAYVTSVGEPTTDMCVWSLERNGFEVVLLNNGSLLADKLKTIYEQADDDFLRVDADVVVNKVLTPEFLREDVGDAWWVQYMCFDWLKQSLSYGGVQYIRKEALPALRSNIDLAHDQDRPETMMSRLPEFYNPRRFESSEVVLGLHGFALGEHTERVYQQKKKRNHFTTFDFELAAKLESMLTGGYER